MARTRSQLPAAVAVVPRRSPRIRKMRQDEAQNTPRANGAGNTPRRGNNNRRATTRRTVQPARRIGSGGITIREEIRNFHNLLNNRNQVQPHPRPHTTNFNNRLVLNEGPSRVGQQFSGNSLNSFLGSSSDLHRPTPRVGTLAVRIPRITAPEMTRGGFSEAGASSRVSTIIEQMEERRQAVRNGAQYAARSRPVYPWGRQIQPTIQRSDITTAIDAEETFWRDIFTFDILNWEHRNLGLNEQQISDLPKKTFRRTRSSRHDSCHVCLLDFQNAEKLLRLPKCGHEFHPDCLKPWVDRHTTCPVCRQSIIRG